MAGSKQTDMTTSCLAALELSAGTIWEHMGRYVNPWELGLKEN